METLAYLCSDLDGNFSLFVFRSGFGLFAIHVFLSGKLSFHSLEKFQKESLRANIMQYLK